MTRRPTLPIALLLAVVVTACAGPEEPTIAAEDIAASPEVEEVASPADEPSAEPSPVADEPSPSDETSPTEAATPEPRTFEEACAGREDEAFIEVLTPLPDSTVSDPITVAGCGNTFEANVVFRVETPEGEVLLEDFTTMTCGNGCVGEFEVDLEVGATGEVVLIAFESSAEDGSEVNVVEVPLTIG